MLEILLVQFDHDPDLSVVFAHGSVKILLIYRNAEMF